MMSVAMQRMLLVLAAVALSFPVDLAAQEPGAGRQVQSGDNLFRTYCASCHGPSAKGDGPIAATLRTPPPDLTLFAQRNEGKFDPEMVRRIIDGRDPVRGHGGRDMPVWGDAFLASRDATPETVEARIVELVRYLESIQQK